MRIPPPYLPRVLTALALSLAGGLTAGCSHDTVHTAAQMRGAGPPVPGPQRDASGRAVGPPAGARVAPH